ncbi:MAG TPA: helix-turn-helix domain-containing protein [Stellaceae bacterium]|nr:helix-turn-helix domain-containing protein [Stellaceae bacterium]
MNDLGEMLLEGLREAVEHAKGAGTSARETVVMVPDRVDVVAIRRRLGLGRAQFAARFGFSVRTVTKWETGERTPEGPARAYLTVIAREPEAVRRALEAGEISGV